MNPKVLLAIAFAVLALQFGPSLGLTCGDAGVVNGSLSGACLLFVPLQVSWFQAELDCRDAGGHLAWFTTNEERRDILSVTQGRVVWVGGRQFNTSGANDQGWRWTSGAPFPNNSWCNNPPGTNQGCLFPSTEPNDRPGAQEDCASLFPNWLNDEDCNDVHNSYVCRFLPANVPPPPPPPRPSPPPSPPPTPPPSPPPTPPPSPPPMPPPSPTPSPPPSPPPTPPPPFPCPPPFTRGSRTGACLFVSRPNRPLRTWAGARSACRNLTPAGSTGISQLAWFTSDEERLDILDRTGGRTIVWVGGLQEPRSTNPAANWQWISGAPWSDAFWCGPTRPCPGGATEPNDARGVDEQCAALQTNYLNDALCSRQRRYVCRLAPV